MNGRILAATVTGIVVAYAVISGLTFLVIQMNPIGADIWKATGGDPELIRKVILSQPTTTFIGYIAANAVGTLIGMAVAWMIRRKGIMQLMIVAGAMLLLNLIKAIAFPHPSWFLMVDLITTLALSGAFIWFASKRVKKA